MNEELKKEVREFILNLIKQFLGKKRFKPQEIEKEVVEAMGDKGITRRDVKKIIREMTDEGILIYGYAGSSFLTLAEEQDKELKGE